MRQQRDKLCTKSSEIKNTLREVSSVALYKGLVKVVSTFKYTHRYKFDWLKGHFISSSCYFVMISNNVKAHDEVLVRSIAGQRVER